MYNYYLDLKNKQIAEAKTHDIEYQLKLKTKRQSERQKLLQCYENRIQKFLYQMADNPIKLKEVKNTLVSTRESLLMEEASKIIGTKGFVFKKHQSDKEKSNEYAIKRKESDLLNKKIIGSQIGTNNDNDSDAPNEINQPNMRFKPRSDMERICEILRNYDERTVTNKRDKCYYANSMSNKHKSKSIKVNKGKAIENEYTVPNYNNKDDDNDRNDHNNKEDKVNPIGKRKTKESTKSSYSHSSQRYKPKILRIDNSKAKKLYPDLYIKTYFKATENYSLMNQQQTCVLDHNTLQSQSESLRNETNASHPHHIQAKSISHTQFINSYNHTETTHSADKCPIHSNSTQKDLLSILNACNSQYTTAKEKEMHLMNTMESVDKFTECMSRVKDKKKIEDKRKLALVEEMAFKGSNSPNKKNNEETIVYSTNAKPSSIMHCNNNDNEESNALQLENKIHIQGEVYDKSDLNGISKKILSTCNWIHHKNKEANETHISRNGKLMCTGGLTISQFERKYNLYPICK